VAEAAASMDERLFHSGRREAIPALAKDVEPIAELGLGISWRLRRPGARLLFVLNLLPRPLAETMGDQWRLALDRHDQACELDLGNLDRSARLGVVGHTLHPP